MTLLLVVITPGFFASKACRQELDLFLERERELGRDDLILPVYYISARELNDPDARASDELATLLASRQFTDWRELRFESLTSPVVRKTIAQTASRMRDTFWNPAGAPGRGAGKKQDRAATRSTEMPGNAGSVTAKAEPPVHVVDVWGRGDFTTVSAAIKAAKPGDRIVVRPGLYEEGLVVDKPLEILGDGPSSQSLSCVAIRNGADPRLRRNQIHGGKQGGVHVYDQGLGTLEDNDITANTSPGVTVKSGGTPTLRRNRVNRNGYEALWIYEGGRGVVEDNDLAGNDRGAWDIAKDCEANVIRRENLE